MADQFWFQLHTRCKLDSDALVEAMFEQLAQPGSLVVPAFYNAVEPVKKVLNAKSMPEAQAMLAGLPKRTGGHVMLRSKEPSSIAWLKWNAQRPMTWHFYIDGGHMQSPAGGAALIGFFQALCSRFPGLVGGGAPQADWQAKHWRTVVSPGGAQGVQKKGLDFRGFITGVYWLTVLGPEAVAHLGKARLQALPVHACLDLGAGGLLLVLRPDPLASALEARLAHDREIASLIGADYIFDIADPDRELQKVPGLG